MQPLENEKALLEKIASGDTRAFSAVFDHYRPNIYTTALRMTGDGPTAEEILQDVFLKVWLKRDGLPGVHNFGGWIFTIAENLTYNAIKKMKRARGRSLELTPETGSDMSGTGTEELLNQKEYRALIQKAVDRLPPRQRETFLLIKEQGLKREDAAQKMGVSAHTVKSNLDNAMRSIRAFCLASLEGWIAIVSVLLSHKK